jgi:hypothetical protein
MDDLSLILEKSGGKAADILANIDWDAATPESLTAQLKEAGIYSVEMADAIVRLCDTMGDAIMGFDAAAAKFKTLHDIIDDIKTGDTITAEQYAELGDGYEDYFMRMADGSYKLIGDAEEFYNKVNSQSM